MSSDAFQGDTVLLRDGQTLKLIGVDEDSGWPIVEIPGQGLAPIDPALIQEGWNGDD
jgi:hypothetical protein